MRAPLLQRRARTVAPAGRDGFTLLEVLVAMVILGFVILGAQASITAMMVRDVGWQDQRARATQMAMDRIHLIQTDPVYTSLVTTYQETGTQVGGFIRATRFTSTAFADGTQYLTVTVTFTGGQLRAPVSRTTVIASP